MKSPLFGPGVLILGLVGLSAVGCQNLFSSDSPDCKDPKAIYDSFNDSCWLCGPGEDYDFGTHACREVGESGCWADEYFNAETRGCEHCDDAPIDLNTGECLVDENGGSSGGTGAGGEGGAAGNNNAGSGAGGSAEDGTGGTMTGGTGGAMTGGTGGTMTGGTGGAMTGGTGGAMTGGTGGAMTGGTGGAMTGGTGGTPVPTETYPCPMVGNCRVLTLGDGVASGVGYTGGYRVQLMASLGAYRVELVGSQSAGTTAANRPHEGFPEYQTTAGGGKMGLVDKLPAVVSTAKPHIVILNVGAEDIFNNFQLNLFRTRLGAVIDKIFMGAPNALIVVSHPAPSRDNTFNTRLTTVDTAIANEVTARRVTQRITRAAIRRTFERPFQPGSVDTDKASATRYYPTMEGYNTIADTYAGLLRSQLKLK